MNSPKHIQDELNELNSSLSANNQAVTYSVPQGYFEGLAASVMAKIKGEETLSATEEIAGLSPLLAGLSRSVPYSVPDGYFASNIESLPAFTSETEESLVLSFIEKEMPYEVPLGYFASLSDKVVEKIAEHQPKVVPMKKRKWMHLAAAAMVSGIIVLSGIAYVNNGSSTDFSKDPVTVEIKNASTEELNDFIKTTDVSLTDEQSTAQNTLEVEQLLKDVSDKELEAFLDQVPTDEEDEFEIN